MPSVMPHEAVLDSIEPQSEIRLAVGNSRNSSQYKKKRPHAETCDRSKMVEGRLESISQPASGVTVSSELAFGRPLDAAASDATSDQLAWLNEVWLRLQEGTRRTILEFDREATRAEVVTEPAVVSSTLSTSASCWGNRNRLTSSKTVRGTRSSGASTRTTAAWAGWMSGLRGVSAGRTDTTAQIESALRNNVRFCR